MKKAITLILIIYLSCFSSASAKQLNLSHLCDGYFDILTGKCLICPKHHKIDITKSADSKDICYQTIKKKAKYSYNTGSILKACKHGSFANFGSTKCYKCPKHYHHDSSKKVKTKGVCYKHDRKPVKHSYDVIEMLASDVADELGKCESGIEHLIPKIPMKPYTASFNQGKVKIKVDGGFAEKFTEGFACEFSKQLVNGVSNISHLKSVSVDDLSHAYYHSCKFFDNHYVMRGVCTVLSPIKDKVTDCVNGVDVSKFKGLFEEISKHLGDEVLNLNLNDMAKSYGKMAADSIMQKALFAGYKGKKKAEKKIEEALPDLLKKVGVPKSVTKSLIEINKVRDKYQDLNKALSVCSL